MVTPHAPPAPDPHHSLWTTTAHGHQERQGEDPAADPRPPLLTVTTPPAAGPRPPRPARSGSSPVLRAAVANVTSTTRQKWPSQATSTRGAPHPQGRRPGARSPPGTRTRLRITRHRSPHDGGIVARAVLRHGNRGPEPARRRTHALVRDRVFRIHRFRAQPRGRGGLMIRGRTFRRPVSAGGPPAPPTGQREGRLTAGVGGSPPACSDWPARGPTCSAALDGGTGAPRPGHDEQGPEEPHVIQLDRCSTELRCSWYAPRQTPSRNRGRA